MNIYKIIRIFALLVFAVSFSVWGYTQLMYLDADVTYKDLQKKVIKTEESGKAEENGTDEKQSEGGVGTENTTPWLYVDTEELFDINHDYICWIYACDGLISYPVVKGKDNEEYLHHTFFGDKSFVGSIFADYRTNMDDFQCLIYGHSMKNRTMFRLIADYKEEEFCQKYPYIYIFGENSRTKYEIFSVYNCNGTEILTALDKSEEEREAFIKELKSRSLYTLPITPTPNDKIISLITCDVSNSDKRVVVNAVKTEEITKGHL
ncbi:MAG: class B sortase [Firmicutes bacterium]|nr:class B sortase [Bacillota bacterium]